MEKFIKDICSLYDLSTSYSRLIFCFLDEQNNRNEIILNSGNKSYIAEKIDVSLGTLNNMITELFNVQIINRKKRGVYVFGEIINNFDKANQINLKINYKNKNRKIETEIYIKGDDNEFR